MMKKIISLLTLSLGLGISATAYSQTDFIDDRGFTYNDEIKQPQVGDNVVGGSFSEQAKNKTETIKGIASKKTGTAAEQGYSTPSLMTEEDVRHIQDQATNARQQAKQIQVIYEGSPILKDKKNKMLVKNWAYILEDLGVSQEKTYFEAQRLSKEDFEEWANGIYQALKQQ